jgi:RNA polymerase sigma factor (sigma-70 family)
MTEQNLTFEDVYANEYIQKSVETSVAEIVKAHPELKMYDDDIKQEIWLEINNALPQFKVKGKASVKTYFRRIIDRRAKNVVRNFLHGTRYFSFLSATPEVEDIIACDTARTMCMENDVEAVVRMLPPRQNAICNLIMAGYSIRNIAKMLNISASSIVEKHIPAIRQRFEEEGLDQYLTTTK